LLLFWWMMFLHISCCTASIAEDDVRYIERKWGFSHEGRML
jgi:hypothetical protein